MMLVLVGNILLITELISVYHLVFKYAIHHFKLDCYKDVEYSR